jgi:hypothetical protein
LSSPKPIASRDAALIAPQYELLRTAHKVTGTGHPFLQGRKGASHIMAGHAIYDRIHKATLMKEIYRLVSIGVIKK